jgi:TonB family protein
MPAWDAPRTAKKKSMTLPIAAGVVIVLAAGGGYFYMRSRSALAVTPAPAATTTHAPAAVTPPPVAASTATSAPVTQTTASAAAAVPQAPPALDPNAINAEVERRLAADRARLEAQQRAQAQQQPPSTRQPVLSGGSVGSQAIAPPRPAQQPVQQQATQTVAPPPVQTNTQPPVQAVATQETAPPPAPARVREGDLIAPGTEGLVMARILRRGTVPYPQIAREQRIEGTVILNVLVGENGQVLDVKVLRGRPAGLDEAAIAIIRRSSFAPPTKDGVRVKAWTTVPVDFKL